MWQNFVAFIDLAFKAFSSATIQYISIVRVTFRICSFLKSHQHIKTLQSIYASFSQNKKDINYFFVYAQSTKESARGRMHACFSSTFNSRQILILKQIKQMKSEGPDILCPLVIYTQGVVPPRPSPGNRCLCMHYYPHVLKQLLIVVANGTEFV